MVDWTDYALVAVSTVAAAVSLGSAIVADRARRDARAIERRRVRIELSDMRAKLTASHAIAPLRIDSASRQATFALARRGLLHSSVQQEEDAHVRSAQAEFQEIAEATANLLPVTASLTEAQLEAERGATANLLLRIEQLIADEEARERRWRENGERVGRG